MLQVAPAATAGRRGHQAPAPVLGAAKSPEGPNELIVKAAVPVFVSVTVIGALVVASSWLPKSRLVGARSEERGVGKEGSVPRCGLTPARTAEELQRVRHSEVGANSMNSCEKLM